MYKIFIILLFSTLLLAKNPYPFSALGDVIYDNVNKIENLKNISIYQLYKNRIDQYIKDVDRVKAEGFALENGSKSISAKEYLSHLRQLAKEYDEFKRNINSLYKKTIKESNNQLFVEVVNSGLLDTEKYKKEIIDYYFNHKDEMDATGIIKVYLDEDAKLKARREALQRHYRSKKAREAERIRFIREEDRLEKERLEKKLQEELRKKKLEIREYQQKELSKTI